MYKVDQLPNFRDCDARLPIEIFKQIEQSINPLGSAESCVSASARSLEQAVSAILCDSLVIQFLEEQMSKLLRIDVGRIQVRFDNNVNRRSLAVYFDINMGITNPVALRLSGLFHIWVVGRQIL